MNFKTRSAIKALNNGGVISIPTDTIQGLSCLPRFESAMQRLVDIKQRSDAKGLILLASDLIYIARYVADESMLIQLAKQTDKPTTYLVKASHQAPKLLLGGHDTIAIRLTKHPLIANLCTQTKSALVSSSANISGSREAKTLLDLRIYFKDELDYIIAPSNALNSPSSIINLHTGEKLR
ncbi:MAG: Sua5/YciO/YrdC/YwlC family protein [Proteobacteria bacterium]|jgi:L-threonylcarbamoyladenylate synthase|nr:Sua5/YciO/YrdC/YwlC family protein [Pseudomonadota bacterium]